ncbi:MAG: Hpt domain-containing protein [Myxococcota bacterium]|nr:Hpt domain-containing protein [Myxococcota bacterium]
MTSIDEHRLRKYQSLQQDGEECFVTRLIDVFLNNAPNCLSGLEHAVGQGCSASIRKSADSLSASSGIIGAVRLAELSRELRRRGDSGEVEAVTEQLPLLRAEYAQVQRQLSHIRDRSL